MFLTININKLYSVFKNVLFGILIGASVMVPGLSGGTTAIILGVYYNILELCDCIYKKPFKSIMGLFPFVLGGICGVFASTYLLKHILNKYSIIFSYFVLGVVLGSIKTFLPEKKMPYIKLVFLFFAGMIPILFQNIFIHKAVIGDSGWLIVLVGLLSAVALILPGISLTNVLIMFNCYEKVINAVSSFDLGFLTVFCVSVIAGSLLTVKIITKLYNKFTDELNCVLCGMISATLPQIFQAFPNKENALVCVSLFTFGIFISSFFARKK